MKKPIPYLESTGITNDYWNEFYGVYLQFRIGGQETVAKLLRESPIREYEQRYPFEEYTEVITRENKTAVRRLNQLARYANSRFADPDFNPLDFARVTHLAYKLIYGEDIPVSLF